MIVCATREICAKLYERIIATKAGLARSRHPQGQDQGRLHRDAPDEELIQQHVRRPSQNKVIKQRAKDPDDELELVIVQSMLLTGYDSPPLHTMYVDRPMRGAALMQALARVTARSAASKTGCWSGTRR